MSAWRLAKSLEKLRSQLNEVYPKRDKTSDGTIGDDSHQASASDHNPNAEGVVCAFDIDTDLGSGTDAHALADHLRIHRHPNLKYIVSKDRICSVKENWAWRKYTGDYHGNHIHISVGVGRDGQSKQPYDDTTPWDIMGQSVPPVVQPKGVTVQVKNAEVFSGVRIPTDETGWGMARLTHNRAANPSSYATNSNGNNPDKGEGHAAHPASYALSSYDGNLIIVQVFGATPNSTHVCSVTAFF